MLNQIHSVAKGLGAKLLLALLVLSFAVWGIEDMLRRPSSNQTVATVGDASISQVEFKQTLSRETERVRNAMGANYSPELLKSLQIPQQILQRMTAQLLMTQEIDALGLKISDDEVIRILRNNQAFHDAKGNFDKEIFRSRLRSSGITEKEYLDQVRQEEAIKLVIQALSVEIPVNEKAIETIYLSRNQERNIDLYVLDTSIIGDISKPDKAQIEEFYKKNQHYFLVPEYRALSYVVFNSKDIEKRIKITDEDLKSAYEDKIDEFRVEETRTVEQLLFSSKEKAEEAKALADKNQSFAEIAKTLNAINKNSVSLGAIAQHNLFDDAAEVVFGMAAKEVSGPIQSPFGWHIFKVVSIQPPGVTPLEQVRDKLEKDIALQKTEDALNTVVTSLEDNMASGLSFTESAKELDLKVHTLPKINRQGALPDGAKAPLPELDKFLDVAFSLEEKTESSVTFSGGGTYYMVYVDEITPEHASPLESVESKAILLWQKTEQEQRLAALMGSNASKLTNKKEFLAFANKHHITPTALSGIKRNGKNAEKYNIPPAMLADIFVRPENDITLPYQTAPGAYAVAIVKGIIPAKLPVDKKARENALSDIREEFSNKAQNELIEQYMNFLSTKYPVKIMADVNQTTLDE